jgi:hypothetical protein
MKEYLLLLRGGRPALTKSEAENKAEMQAWGDYMAKLGKKGSLVGGMPLISGGMLLSAGAAVSEPVNTAREGIIGGYLIIKAESLQTAAVLAKDCPHIANDGNIEVREIGQMPAMS